MKKIIGIVITFLVFIVIIYANAESSEEKLIHGFINTLFTCPNPTLVEAQEILTQEVEQHMAESEDGVLFRSEAADAMLYGVYEPYFDNPQESGFLNMFTIYTSYTDFLDYIIRVDKLKIIQDEKEKKYYTFQAELSYGPKDGPLKTVLQEGTALMNDTGKIKHISLSDLFRKELSDLSREKKRKTP